MVKPTDNWINPPSKSLSPPTGEGVVIDIGTGDGLFVYQSARQNPRKFYIGLDANPQPLEKISEKMQRKPAKGGLPVTAQPHVISRPKAEKSPGRNK